MDNEKLPRREREKLRQRQEMIDAALILFSEKGYHNVTMHQIAEKAEFAIGTLYKFFQNKEELYKALVLEECDKFEEEIDRALEEPEGELEKLRSYIRVRRQLFYAHLPFVRLFLAERRGASFNIRAGMDDDLRKRHYVLLEKLGEIFDSGIRANRFRKIAEPFHLAVALDSMIDAFLLLWLDAPERCSFPEDPDAILNVFFHGLVQN